eukprot:CAMPEP_0181384170 /NCGR_PEP_ID=MMETSP1106-20121128/21801_1 /TAXON_ID=81844 /ORGANISM="Mantoniella antarctica, Strain SL-175" /LENGTH=53 /DNA_ID=CAMNT_0023503981 /DNA_START=25 /DNA_END=183 /DNA_ORIENTATION=+
MAWACFHSRAVTAHSSFVVVPPDEFAHAARAQQPLHLRHVFRVEYACVPPRPL